jgi:hypothetical protein
MDADLFDFLAPASKVAHTSSTSALAKKRKKDKPSSSRSSRPTTPAAPLAPEASGSGSRSLSPSSEEGAPMTKSKKPRVSQLSDDEPTPTTADPMASLEASGSGGGGAPAAMAVDGELVSPAVEQQQQDAPLPVVADEFSEETARVVEPSKAGLSAPVPEGEQAEGGGIKLTHQVGPSLSSPGSAAATGRTSTLTPSFAPCDRSKVRHRVAIPPSYPYTPISQHKFNDPPARSYPFELDPFQKVSVASIERGESVLVSAHTSAGKTVVAEYAIAQCLSRKERVIYTSPIKVRSARRLRENLVAQPNRSLTLRRASPWPTRRSVTRSIGTSSPTLVTSV